jgi:hypothetical protein
MSSLTISWLLFPLYLRTQKSFQMSSPIFFLFASFKEYPNQNSKTKKTCLEQNNLLSAKDNYLWIVFFPWKKYLQTEISFKKGVQIFFGQRAHLVLLDIQLKEMQPLYYINILTCSTFVFFHFIIIPSMRIERKRTKIFRRKYIVSATFHEI